MEEIKTVVAFECPGCKTLHHEEEKARECCPLLGCCGLAGDYILRGGKVIDGNGVIWGQTIDGLIPGNMHRGKEPFRKYGGEG